MSKMEDSKVRLDLLILKLSAEFNEQRPLSQQSFVQTFRTLKKIRGELKPSPELRLAPDFLTKVAEALNSKEDPVLKRLGLVAVNSLDSLLNVDQLLRNFGKPDHPRVIAWRESLLLPEEEEEQEETRPLRRRRHHGRRGDVFARRLAAGV